MGFFNKLNLVRVIKLEIHYSQQSKWITLHTWKLRHYFLKVHLKRLSCVLF